MLDRYVIGNVILDYLWVLGVVVYAALSCTLCEQQQSARF